MKNEINPFTGKPKYPQRVTYLFPYTGSTSEPRAHEAAREFSGEIEQLSESCTQVVMRDEWQVTVVFANKTQRAIFIWFFPRDNALNNQATIQEDAHERVE